MSDTDVVPVTDGAETFTCNAYLVPGAVTTLVDAGAWDGVVDAVREHVDDVDRVVITHQDLDHVHQLPAVCEAFGPEVYAHDDHELRTHPLADGDALGVGDETADVVFTPGHAQDHVSLVTETSLFSGDAVVHNDGAFDYGSFGKTNRPKDDREQLIESIRRLLDRMPDSVEHMYAGHGDVFHGDVRDVVETALERAEKREPKYPDE